MNKILKKQAVQLMNCLFFIFLCGNCLAHTPRSEYPTSVSYKKGYKIHTGYWILTWYQARE